MALNHLDRPRGLDQHSLSLIQGSPSAGCAWQRPYSGYDSRKMEWGLVPGAHEGKTKEVVSFARLLM